MMKQSPRAIIELRDICKDYESINRTIRALKEISFDVLDGEIVAIIGPSGCGKSTLIRLIGDLLQPTSGTISVNGITPAEARSKRLFSYVFQNPVLLPWRKVIENIRLPLEILDSSPAEFRTRDPHELLKMVGLSDFAEVYPQDLSGGMRHRVALARALVFEPQILFMDEPFASIDELTRNTLNVELLRIWQDVKVTILYITHSLVEAVFLSNRVIVLSARPAGVKDILEVSLPYPREESFRDSIHFREMVRWLRERLDQAN